MQYQNCIDQQILSWHKASIQRYQLMDNGASFFRSLPGPKCKDFNSINSKVISITGNPYFNGTKAHSNHPKLWNEITKIILHTTTKKLLTHTQLYPAFYKCFGCCGQTPRLIKSNRSIAAFKVIRGAIVGAQSHLHKKTARLFCYKWYFLSAELNTLKLDLQKKKNSSSALTQVSIGINNIFIFPELDKLSYDLFQPIPGLDLTFQYT